MWNLLGNSMASCIVQRILVRFLRLLRPAEHFVDPWETGDAQRRLAVVAVPGVEVVEAAVVDDVVSCASEAVEDESGDDAMEVTAGVDELSVDRAVAREVICTPATRVWQAVPRRTAKDTVGQGRIPAFWYTLNLPYNHLFDIHRFLDAVERCRQFLPGDDPDDLPVERTEHLDSLSREAEAERCTWALNNPDIVAMLQALRVELHVRGVMSKIVPEDADMPFQYWLRFEFGASGNPHVHGQNWVAGNPQFEYVAKDEAALQRMVAANHPQAEQLRTWQQAEQEIADFYDRYVSEMHPCRDADGADLYGFNDLTIENLQLPYRAKPQCVRLLPLLEAALRSEEPDLMPLKEVLLALIETGQRHTLHGFHAPHVGQACAKKGRTSEGHRYVYCRYLFPRELQQFEDGVRGVVREDPHRPGLRSLCLRRNDALLNNFESHMLLLNLGNIDWRALLNLWSVLEYLTKYTTKGGKGSRQLGQVFDEVLQAVHQYEEADGIHDLWRRTIMRFYSKVIGDREYSLFETVHFGLCLPPTLSSLSRVTSVSVSNWAALKRDMLRQQTKFDERVTFLSKLEVFDCRGDLPRTSLVSDEELSNLSFYAFWRMYDYRHGKVTRRRGEQIVAVNGIGWPAMAARSHPDHEEYCRKTLYAYMPCDALCGVSFIDATVRSHYGGSYSQLLRHFCRAKENKWCPPWVARNFEACNPDDDFACSDCAHEEDAPEEDAVSVAAEVRQEQVDAASEGVFPHADQYQQHYVFDEVPGDAAHSEEEEAARPVTAQPHWRQENREP